MKKNQWILLISVVVGVAAAVAATVLILKKLEIKKKEIESADLSFETDFTEEEADADKVAEEAAEELKENT